MGWQAVYLLAHDLAVSDQPPDQAAAALLVCAPQRDAHEAARLRYLGGRSDPPDDVVAQRALSYLEHSIRMGDASGRWISGSPAGTSAAQRRLSATCANSRSDSVSG